MPHLMRRRALWVSCRCCAVHGAIRPVGRFPQQRRSGGTPQQRRSGGELRAGKKLLSLDSVRYCGRLNQIQRALCYYIEMGTVDRREVLADSS